MALNTNPHGTSANAAQSELNQEVNRAIDQVKSDVDELIAGLDLQNVTRRIEDFGRTNPFGLAVAALGVGVAAGLLLRRGSGASSSASPSETRALRR